MYKYSLKKKIPQISNMYNSLNMNLEIINLNPIYSKKSQIKTDILFSNRNFFDYHYSIQ